MATTLQLQPTGDEHYVIWEVHDDENHAQAAIGEIDWQRGGYRAYAAADLSHMIVEVGICSTPEAALGMFQSWLSSTRKARGVHSPL